MQDIFVPRKPKPGRIKPSLGPHAVRGPWIDQSWSTPTK